jgi:hypothetical protein
MHMRFMSPGSRTLHTTDATAAAKRMAANAAKRRESR